VVLRQHQVRDHEIGPDLGPAGFGHRIVAILVSIALGRSRAGTSTSTCTARG
jgi:hypothetical protein